MTATFFDILVEPQLLGVTIAEILEGEVFNGKGAVKLVDDHLYKGQFKNGKLHGQGALTWSDGSKFVGEFANNQVIGKGTYTWPDGSKYEGDIKNGQRHGFGTFTSTTGMKYKGDWREGKREGWGVLFYNKEETMFYDGEFHDNVRSGWGRMIYQSHNVYEGRWLNNKRHGLGRMCWNSRGEVFTGNWKDDKQDGIGEHTYHLSNLGQYPFYYSNRYVGFFNQGKRDGPGSFFYADGGRYEGNWTANKKDGAGLLLTSGGQLYEGKFVHDKMTAVTLQQANTIGSAQGKARISTSPEDLIDSEKMKAQATAQQTTADQNTNANTNLISSATGASFSQPDIGISDLIPLYLAPPVVIGHARLIPNTQPGSGASLGLSASTGVGGNERVGQSNSQQQGLMQSAQSVISEVMMLLTRYGQEIKQLYLWLAAQRDYLNPSSTTVSSAAAQIWANPSIKRNSASFQPSPVGKPGQPGQPDLQQSSTNMQSLGSNEGSTVGFQTLGRPNRNYMGTMRTLRGKMTHDGLSPNVLLNMLLNQKKGSNAGAIDRRSLETSLLTASSISLGQGMQQSNQNKQLTHGINIPQLISTPALTTTSPSISVAPSLSSFWLFATLAGFASSPKLTPSPFAIQQQQTAVKQHKNKTSQSNATNQQGGNSASSSLNPSINSSIIDGSDLINKQDQQGLSIPSASSAHPPPISLSLAEITVLLSKSLFEHSSFTMNSYDPPFLVPQLTSISVVAQTTKNIFPESNTRPISVSVSGIHPVFIFHPSITFLPRHLQSFLVRLAHSLFPHPFTPLHVRLHRLLVEYVVPFLSCVQPRLDPKHEGRVIGFDFTQMTAKMQEVAVSPNTLGNGPTISGSGINQLNNSGAESNSGTDKNASGADGKTKPKASTVTASASAKAKFTAPQPVNKNAKKTASSTDATSSSTNPAPPVTPGLAASTGGSKDANSGSKEAAAASAQAATIAGLPPLSKSLNEQPSFFIPQSLIPTLQSRLRPLFRLFCLLTQQAPSDIVEYDLQEKEVNKIEQQIQDIERDALYGWIRRIKEWKKNKLQSNDNQIISTSQSENQLQLHQQQDQQQQQEQEQDLQQLEKEELEKEYELAKSLFHLWKIERFAPIEARKIYNLRKQLRRAFPITINKVPNHIPSCVICGRDLLHIIRRARLFDDRLTAVGAAYCTQTRIYTLEQLKLEEERVRKDESALIRMLGLRAGLSIHGQGSKSRQKQGAHPQQNSAGSQSNRGGPRLSQGSNQSSHQLQQQHQQLLLILNQMHIQIEPLLPEEVTDLALATLLRPSAVWRHDQVYDGDGVSGSIILTGGEQSKEQEQNTGESKNASRLHTPSSPQNPHNQQPLTQPSTNEINQYAASQANLSHSVQPSPTLHSNVSFLSINGSQQSTTSLPNSQSLNSSSQQPQQPPVPLSQLSSLLDRPLVFPEFIQSIIRCAVLKYSDRQHPKQPPYPPPLPQPPQPPQPTPEEIAAQQAEEEAQRLAAEQQAALALKAGKGGKQQAVAAAASKDVKKTPALPDTKAQATKDQPAKKGAGISPPVSQNDKPTSRPTTSQAKEKGEGQQDKQDKDETDKNKECSSKQKQPLEMQIGRIVPLTERVEQFIDELLGSVFGDQIRQKLDTARANQARQLENDAKIKKAQLIQGTSPENQASNSTLGGSTSVSSSNFGITGIANTQAQSNPAQLVSGNQSRSITPLEYLITERDVRNYLNEYEQDREQELLKYYQYQILHPHLKEQQRKQKIEQSKVQKETGQQQPKKEGTDQPQPEDQDPTQWQRFSKGAEDDWFEGEDWIQSGGSFSLPVFSIELRRRELLLERDKINQQMTDELKQVRASNGGLGEEQQDVDQSITQYLQSDIGDRNTVNEEEEEYDEDDDDMGDYGDDDQDNMIDDQLGGSGYY